MGSKMDTVAYFEAKQKLEQFLRDNPEAREFQGKIDEMLRGAGNQNNRNVLLQKMMRDNMGKLTKELDELVSALTEITGE